jgi:methylase of polypeptide subunit release factors
MEKNKFESTQYNNYIRDLLINNPFKNAINEEMIRKTLESETNDLLRSLGLNENKNIIFISEERTSKGRIDSRYKNIIIEYKKYGLLDNLVKLDEAKEQLFSYLLDKKFNYSKTYGFLFDGKTMEVYVKDHLNNIKEVDKKINGKLNYKSYDFFFRTAFLSNFKELNPLNIKEDFSIENINKLSANLVKSLHALLAKSNNIRTSLLFNEWQKMFKLSENDGGQHLDILQRRGELSKIFNFEINDSKSEYLALFSLHTGFSIIIKSLLLKVILESKKNTDYKDISEVVSQEISNIKNTIIELENGNTLKKFGIINMIEGDFFSWYTKENWDSQFVNSLKNILIQLSAYEEIKYKKYSLVEDLFRDLYESFIPAIVRHCFGEYYTPYWLAESVLEHSDYVNGNSVLDPCCGSGTFLMCVLNKRIKENEGKRYSFSELTNGIAGIDLNPLAVLMARLNLFLNAVPFVDDYNKIELPIYLGDSTYIPQLVNIDNIPCINYELLTSGNLIDEFLEITLPYNFVNKSNFIEKMDELEKLIIRKRSDEAKDFLNKNSNPSRSLLVEETVNKLVDDLIKLEQRNLNSIWLRIFANFLKTSTLQKFDLIVGNPPWVSWGVLPENYRNKVKSKIRFEGLFSNDKNTGGNNLNICALISNKSAEKWLSKTGKLAFLMPKTILFNKSYEGFRNFKIGERKLYFQKIIDWSEGGHPFDPVKLDFCTFIFSESVKSYKTGIKYVNAKKKAKTTLSRNSTFSDESEKFVFTNKLAVQLDEAKNNNFTILENENELSTIKNIVGEFNYTFRKGIGPKFLMRLKFVQNYDEKLAYFSPYEKIGKRIKVSSIKILLEKSLIYPFVTAPMIQKDKLNWINDYVIVPYKEKTKIELTEDELKVLAPRVYRYLLDNYKFLTLGSKYNQRVQNTKQFYGIIRVGNYSFSNHKLAIRDNTKFICSLIKNIETHWKETKVTFLDGHISYISEATKGTNQFISLDEAYYIKAILDLKEVKKYVENSSDSRSIGTKFSVKLEKYDPKNVKHRKISELSKTSYQDKENQVLKAYLGD